MAANRRRNVQEQNAETKERIRALAASFKDAPLRFEWLIRLLQAQAMPVDQGILVSFAHVPEQCAEQYSGSWLTHEGRFFRFAVLVSRTDAALDIEEWRDVTAETIVNPHLPGTGKSFGFLASEVLREVLS